MNEKSTPNKKQNSDSEISEQQKLEKLTDGSTLPNDEIKTLNQSPSNQSTIKLNQLKQIRKTDEHQSQQSEKSENRLAKSNDAFSPESDKNSEHERTKYEQLAQKTKSELGNISQLRMDMEIYYRETLTMDDSKTKDEGKKLLKQSNKYRQLAKQDPKLAKKYLNAIANSSSTYQRLPKKTKNLDSVTDRLVNLNLAKQTGNKEIESSPIHKTKSQEGQQLEQYRKNTE